jgi:hypothetical protein
MSQPKLDVYGYGCKLFMTLVAGDQPVDRVLLWPVADRLRQSLLRRQPQRDQLLHRIVLSGINSIKLWKVGFLPVGLMISGPNVSGANLCEDIN